MCQFALPEAFVLAVAAMLFLALPLDAPLDRPPQSSGRWRRW